MLRGNFWASYAMMCLAIPGPFAAMGPFWALAGETLPRSALGVIAGLVNAFGNLGGYAGPSLVGWMARETHSTASPFKLLGVGMLICAGLAFLLPRPNPNLQSPKPTA